MATVVVAGCGQAFSLASGTSGSGGAGGDAATTVTASASSSGGATSTSSSSSSSSSATSSASSTGSGPGGCTWNPQSNPCGPKQFCEDPSCGQNNSKGICKPKPQENSDDKPVCGCNGITYWNESVAGAHGVPAPHIGACIDLSKGISCVLPTDCPANSGASCRKAKSGCDGSVTGDCWVLPSGCGGTSVKVQSCLTNDCQPACEVIKTNTSYDPSQACG